MIDVRPIGDESFEYAALLWLVGDKSRYDEFCQQLVARTGDPQGLDAYYLAHVCALGPADRIEPEKIVQWAARFSTSPIPWTQTVLALAEFRAQQFETAIEHFQQSRELPGGEYLDAHNAFGLSMANFRLGRLDAARESLELGRQRFQRAQPTKPNGAALPGSPGEWIEQQLLSHEAEMLFRSPVGADL